ncbi:uncharacterized protein MEPE_02445 [Melanopsichium pennsylvanicum]|uniref:TAFII28-like protein domain-containing protein n=2 Tax=Melanopsichium pennsylvanicum TaxID=63383 RepID=A0AAJ4XMF8_9BASI|nr:tafii28-domain-containing protein [Melanopsichium pennsylvanicum 4]SNX83738.1 uncharacterized protein MEPE_02445 [Melanopsichium pennsylvanicum]
MSSHQPQDVNMPDLSTEGVIPSSFFDMPIDFGGGDANIEFGSASGSIDFGSIPGLSTSNLPISSDATDFETLTAQIAANMPPVPVPSHPIAGTSYSTELPRSYPAVAGKKLEIDDSASAAGSSPMLVELSTPKPTATKAKKPSKPKTEGGAEAKPKKPKKKPAAAAASAPTTATDAAVAEGSNDVSDPTAVPKLKKVTKKKAAADKAKDSSKDAALSATASPAPFATPASPTKESKPKAKKAGGSKIGGKGTGKARPSTARSASRISSIGRDAATPAMSRLGSQRPQDEANDDEEALPERSAPQVAEEDEVEDEEAEADDGVEELGKDHFSTQEAIYAAQQRNMGLLSMVMDEDQLDRHMASRRGALNKTSVRKLVNHVLSQSVSQHVAMVVSGVAKIFVGEIVEKARNIQKIRGERGPLRPNHLREAHRHYYLQRERPGHYPPGTNTGFTGVGKRRRMF